MFFQNTERTYLRMLAELALLAVAVFAAGALLTRAQVAKPAPGLGVATVSNDEPLLRDYKGVTIGMTADETRARLGTPADKGERQDFYQFSESESAQVFYDAAGRVSALSVHYFGEAAAAPNPKAIFGTDAETRPDGSVYKLVKYVRAGYWVCYNRTPGEQPITSVSIKRDAP